MDSNQTTAGNTTGTWTCAEAQRLDILFVLFAMIPSLIFLFILSFLKKRKSLCFSCCSARPGLIYPINFVEEFEHRWAYAAAFGVISYRILYLFENKFYFTKEDFNPDPNFYGRYGFLTVFIQAFNVVWVTLVFYPLYVCLGLGYHFVANIIGLISVFVWMADTIWVQLACFHTWIKLENGTIGGIEVSEDIVRTWNNDILLNLIYDIPVILCYFSLLFAFLWDMYRNFRRCCRKHQGVTEPSAESGPSMPWSSNYKNTTMMESQPMQYLKGLLERRTVVASTMKEKVVKKARYQNIQGFRYSPRVLCTMVLGAMCLFKFCLMLGVSLDPLFKWMSDRRDLGLQLLEQFGVTVTPAYSGYANDAVYALRSIFHVTNAISFVLHLAFMVHIILNYRKNVQRIFRGKMPWTFKYVPSPTSELVASVRYSGYQVAYMIYGYFIMWTLLFIIVIAFTLLIVLPLKYKVVYFVINFIIAAWPTVLISLLIWLMQVLLCKFVFLQDRGAYMALNNRRGFHVFTYLMFFYNVLLGLFSCLRRILLSLVFGVMLLSRLDFCLMAQGFTRFDSGYRAYMGILILDSTHNHPLLKAFLMILAENAHNKHHGIANGYADKSLGVLKSDTEAAIRARARWWKAYTLLKNPTLVLERLKITHKEKRKTIDDIVDGVADVLGGAGVLTIGSMVGGAATAVGSGIVQVTEF